MDEIARLGPAWKRKPPATAGRRRENADWFR